MKSKILLFKLQIVNRKDNYTEGTFNTVIVVDSIKWSGLYQMDTVDFEVDSH